ncbi:MAG TPA: hypothetical protein VJ890_25660 [Vineibacter sp.]|nr:hypothetical protein [Vineibacter sp.]
MDLTGLKASLTAASPPTDLSAPLIALWWAAKGEWKTAHEVAQQHDDRPSAWVHAYLHRVEGDLSNAGYWYRRAHQPAATESLESEWSAIATALLASAD